MGRIVSVMMEFVWIPFFVGYGHKGNRMMKWLSFCGLIGLLILMVFSSLFGDSAVLFSTDNNIGSEAMLRNALMSGFGAFWSDSSLLGGLGLFWPNFMGLLLLTMPLGLYVNWVHVIEMVMASFFLLLFLRKCGILSMHAHSLAWITAFWMGCNFTLLYSGHTAKFGTLAFSALTLWCIRVTVQQKSVTWAILSGGGMAIALLEQQDVALFFGIFVGAYAVFCMVRQYGWRWLEMTKLLGSMGAIILLIAGPPSLSLLKSQTEGISAGADESPQGKWNFVTQWSQPPDETVDLIAPGYMGWRSGEPEGPYWGRCGRSAGWEQTRQGFMNFRLDNLYIGALPIVFALFAFIAALCTKRKSENAEACEVGWKDRRAEILFWSAVAIITLLLAYGKYTPLYWLFYQLPVVNNIRAPVKFLQVFQVALAILTAYGLDFAVQWAKCRRISVRQ